VAAEGAVHITVRAKSTGSRASDDVLEVEKTAEFKP